MKATYYTQRVDTYIWYVIRKLDGLYGGFTEIASIETNVADARREARTLQEGEKAEQRYDA